MKIENSKGFTILEILIVVSVIVILIGVVLVRFKGMQDEANIVKAKGEINTLMLAIESYKMNSGSSTYPSYPAGTVYLQRDHLLTATPKILPGYLYDPFGPTKTTEYTYISSDDALYYAVYSVTPGTSAPTSVGSNGTLYYSE